MAEINLIKKQKKDHEQQLRTAHIAQAVAVLSVLLLLASGIVLYLLKQSYNTQALETEQTQAQAAIQSMHPKAVKLLLTRDRISSIEKILKQRGAFNQATNEILSRVPSDVSLKSFSLDGSKLTITATSASLNSIDQLIQGLVAISGPKKLLSTVMLDGLSTNISDGTYTVNLEATQI